MALKVSNHMWVKHSGCKGSQESAPLCGPSRLHWQSKGQGQHPNLGSALRLHRQSRTSTPCGSSRLHWQSRTSTHVWVKQAALAVKVGHPCMGQGGYIGSQGVKEAALAVKGSSRLHWQSKAKIISTKTAKQWSVSMKWHLAFRYFRDQYAQVTNS